MHLNQKLREMQEKKIPRCSSFAMHTTDLMFLRSCIISKLWLPMFYHISPHEHFTLYLPRLAQVDSEKLVLMR